MSHAPQDAHGSGRTHHPHVLPIRIYAVVAAALLILTFVTVKVSYYNFGVMNLFVAMGVATLKATLVVLFFMHLKYDEKFNAIVFVGSLTFLTIFFVLTLADTMERGRVDALETHELVPVPARPELVDRRSHPSETAQPGAHGLERPATGDSLNVATPAESAGAHGATAPGESTQVPGGH